MTKKHHIKKYIILEKVRAKVHLLFSFLTSVLFASWVFFVLKVLENCFWGKYTKHSPEDFWVLMGNFPLFLRLSSRTFPAGIFFGGLVFFFLRKYASKSLWRCCTVGALAAFIPCWLFMSLWSDPLNPLSYLGAFLGLILNSTQRLWLISTLISGISGGALYWYLYYNKKGPPHVNAN